MNGITIISVTYNDNDKKDYITHVRAANFTSEDNITIDYLGRIVTWEKSQIIDMVTDTPVKANVYTAIYKNNTWIIGSKVEAVPHDNPKYIRTIGNSVEEDNLGDLPVDALTSFEIRYCE